MRKGEGQGIYFCLDTGIPRILDLAGSWSNFGSPGFVCAVLIHIGVVWLFLSLKNSRYFICLLFAAMVW